MTLDRKKKSETIEDDKEKAETPASGSAKTLGYNPRTNEDYIPKAKESVPDSASIGRVRNLEEA